MARVLELIPRFSEVAFGGDGGDLLAALDDFSPLLLDSGEGGEGGGFTILGLLPRRSFSWSTGEASPVGPFERLRSWLSRFLVASHPRWPFVGGLMGWLSYDLRGLLERLPVRHPRETSLPDLYMGDYRLTVLRDLRKGETVVCRLEQPGDLSGNRFLENAQGEVARRLEAFHQRGGLPPPPPEEAQAVPLPSREAHCQRVEQALAAIRRGDIYQVNLAQRFEARRPANLLRFYRRLRRSYPASFGAFARFGREALISISPERFLSLEGGLVRTSPIKGTAPREEDEAQDRQAARQLLDSSKDRAELAMIVDVLRNDLARVCVPGSVTVLKPVELLTLPTVHHLVADIRGRLEEGRDAIDLLKAAFPGGSVTGAPRIRAMEIIDELETCRRGIYTGSLGYLGYDGRMDFNILIRTAVSEGDRLFFHGGGAIVADSDPLSEYLETIHKVRSFLSSLGSFS